MGETVSTGDRKHETLGYVISPELRALLISSLLKKKWIINSRTKMGRQITNLVAVLGNSGLHEQ